MSNLVNFIEKLMGNDKFQLTYTDMLNFLDKATVEEKTFLTSFEEKSLNKKKIKELTDFIEKIII